MNRKTVINWKDPRYGLFKKFKTGERILCFLTFRCNLDCGYCTLKFTDGEMPVSAEMDLEGWKYLINNQFPRPIREVVLSGGEPMMMPFYSELVNWLLHEKKIFVSVWSNLTTTGGLGVRASYRYRICATYHHSANLERFKKSSKKYIDKYRVDLEEIGGVAILPGSILKPYSTLQDCDQCQGFFFSPEGRMFPNFLTIDRHYAKTNIDIAGGSENGEMRKIRAARALKVVPTEGE